jgi:putative Mg2+ transporter-C (MgtC) family protein
MEQTMSQFAEALQLGLLLKLGLATLLGGVIGLERELSGKPAGLRTNILICIGATLFTVVSIHMIPLGQEGRLDASRIPAQIVSGVGFIGAGAILHARGSVTGLTSAATIWVVAAIGVALGTSAYIEAVGTALLVMLVLWGLRSVERLVARQSAKSHVFVHARPEASAPEEIEALMRRSGLDVDRFVIRKENVDLVLELELRGPKRLHDQAMIALLHHPAVRTVSTGE